MGAVHPVKSVLWHGAAIVGCSVAAVVASIALMNVEIGRRIHAGTDGAVGEVHFLGGSLRGVLLPMAAELARALKQPVSDESASGDWPRLADPPVWTNYRLSKVPDHWFERESGFPFRCAAVSGTVIGRAADDLDHTIWYDLRDGTIRVGPKLSSIQLTIRMSLGRIGANETPCEVDAWIIQTTNGKHYLVPKRIQVGRAIANGVVYWGAIQLAWIAGGRIRRYRRQRAGRCGVCGYNLTLPGPCPECGQAAVPNSRSVDGVTR